MGRAAKRVPMAAHADPDWEVATVRPSGPNEKGDHIDLHGRHVTLHNETAEMMLVIGYNVQKNQILGAPDWVKTERWDVDGLADVDGEPNVMQLQTMVRKALQERFGLKLHREQREMPVYALTVAKGGPRLTTNTTDPNGVPRDDGGASNGWGSKQFTNTSMRELALILMFYTDRLVVDQTGLGGRYDFKLQWTADEMHATDPDAPPGLFTAMQEQLGLKLEAVRAPAAVLVVDAVERLGAN